MVSCIYKVVQKINEKRRGNVVFNFCFFLFELKKSQVHSTATNFFFFQRDNFFVYFFFCIFRYRKILALHVQGSLVDEHLQWVGTSNVVQHVQREHVELLKEGKH